jgi:putative ABC transport system permease protein
MDLLGLSVSALWQQKARTIFTTLGVIFGSFVLAASLSIGQGVQRTIRSFVASSEILRQIQVYPGSDDEEALRRAAAKIDVRGTMSDARRERLRSALAQREAQALGARRTLLDRAALRDLAQIEHVQVVAPLAGQQGYAILGGESRPSGIAGVRPDDPVLRGHVVAGRFFERADEPGVLVSESLLYHLGATDEKDVERFLGRPLRFETRPQQSGLMFFIQHADGSQLTREEASALARIRALFPAALDRLGLGAGEREVLRRALQTAPAGDAMLSREFPIVGVVSPLTAEEQSRRWGPYRPDADLMLGFQTATDLFFQTAGRDERSLDLALVVVDDEENVQEVFEDIRWRGLGAYAPLEYIKRQRLLYLLIFTGMTCVAVVSLVVAALGIANTMLISVLERTREIGVMKAVGADNRHLQAIFLIEGALIGCAGGVIGLLATWAASFPGDAWIRSIVTRNLHVDMKESVFVFPWWLIWSVLVLSLVVTVVAALYPARRAAGVDAVVALRHE